MFHSLKPSTVQLAILKVWSSTLDVWLPSILNVPLKAALSEIMKILVIINFNLIQGLGRGVFKNTISRKNQSKSKPNELVN